MWIIISFVTALEFFGPKPHPFSSRMHFITEDACRAHMPDDADELLAELDSIGLTGSVHLEAHCEIDMDGDPA